MRKIAIVIVALILLQFTLLLVNNNVLALESPITNPEAYQPTNSDGNEKIFSAAGSILGAIRNIGIIVSVLAIMIVGVKYILGSVEEKAEYKQTMVPIVVGIVIISSIITIIDIIHYFTNFVFGQ